METTSLLKQPYSSTPWGRADIGAQPIPPDAYDGERESDPVWQEAMTALAAYATPETHDGHQAGASPGEPLREAQESSTPPSSSDLHASGQPGNLPSAPAATHGGPAPQTEVPRADPESAPCLDSRIDGDRARDPCAAVPPLDPAQALAYRTGMLSPQVRERMQARAAREEALLAAYRSRSMSPLAMVHERGEVMRPLMSAEATSARDTLSTGLQSPVAARELLYSLAQTSGASWDMGRYPDMAEARVDLAATKMAELEPANGAQAMLAAQAVMMHDMAMRVGRLASDKMGDDTETVRHLCRTVAELSRTTGQHLLALRQLKEGHHQSIRVERVEIQAGAQAVVGSVQVGTSSAGQGGGTGVSGFQSNPGHGASVSCSAGSPASRSERESQVVDAAQPEGGQE